MAVVGFSLGNSFYQVAIFESGRARLVLQTKPCDVVKLVNLTEDVLGSELGSVVVAVPTLFTYTQCQKIEEECSAIGLHVLRVIKDTSAVSLAHAYSSCGRSGTSSRFLLVYQEQHDLGVSVASVDNNVIEMESKTGGHPWQDSHSIQKLVEYFAADYGRRFECDLSDNPDALKKLRTAALDATSQLSSEWYATVSIRELDRGVDYAASITKAEVEELNKKAFQQSVVEYVKECLKGQGETATAIEQLVLLEGFDQNSLNAIERDVFLGKLPAVLYLREDTAAIGAALQAAVLNGKLDWLLVDATTFDLRVESRNKETQVVLPRNTRLPASKELVFDPSSWVFPIHLYEGNHSNVAANDLVASLEPYQANAFVAHLDIDANGCISLQQLKGEGLEAANTHATTHLLA